MSEGNTTAQTGEQLRPIRELLGEHERNVASGASQIEGAVNPASGWSNERRESFARKRRETAERKRAEKGLGPGTYRTKETILEVKGEPEPEKQAPPPTQKDIEGWAGMIYLSHALFAPMINLPEFRLDKTEAQELSVASMNVMRHYGTAILSEKTQDMIKLGMVMSAIYIPKMARVNTRKREAKAKKTQTPPGMNAAGGFERKEVAVEEQPEMENEEHF